MSIWLNTDLHKCEKKLDRKLPGSRKELSKSRRQNNSWSSQRTLRIFCLLTSESGSVLVGGIKLFEDIMIKKIPNLMKTINL